MNASEFSSQQQGVLNGRTVAARETKQSAKFGGLQSTLHLKVQANRGEGASSTMHHTHLGLLLQQQVKHGDKSQLLRVVLYSHIQNAR